MLACGLSGYTLPEHESEPCFDGALTSMELCAASDAASEAARHRHARSQHAASQQAAADKLFGLPMGAVLVGGMLVGMAVLGVLRVTAAVGQPLSG